MGRKAAERENAAAYARHRLNPRPNAEQLLTSEEIRTELVAGFRAQLTLYPDHVVGNVNQDHALEFGRRAARAAIAPAVWASVIDGRLDTGEAVALLGVSRQALAKRVANGTLIGLPGRGTTYYPVWQFDRDADPPRVRPAVAAALAAWSEESDRVDPFAVVAWARTRQPELDNDMSPIDLLRKHDTDTLELINSLAFSARATAARLAQ